VYAHPTTIRRGILIACAAVGATACSDSATTAARRGLTVSLSTQSQGAIANRAVADRTLADVTIAAGTSTLVLTKAQVVARRIELAPSNAAACAGTSETGDDDAELHDGCAEVEAGPALLDLPLDASTKTNITASVPPGTYRGLELRIGPVSSGNRRSVEFLTAHPDFKNASVRVEGTYNGKAFVFVSPVDARIETLFSAPITVDASNPNVTVAIDVTNWFTDGAGATLDPSNSANASRIAANIAGSFHAFEDDDHDGHDDRHR
jgi:hypothetical protein